MANKPTVTTSSAAFANGWTWAASIAVHAGIMALTGWVAFRTMHRPPAPSPPAREGDVVVPVELPTVAEGSLVVDRPPDVLGSLPVHSGGDTVPRVDTGHSGRGGEATVDRAAIHLSDRDERLRLSTDLLSRLDRDQAQRVRSSPVRSSFEDRRATTHPAELTFIATGAFERAERRAPSSSDPSRGALEARAPSVRGGEVGTPDPFGDEGSRSALGGLRAGSLNDEPGRGVRDRKPGDDHHVAAAVGYVRPDVVRGPVAVQAAEKGKTRDDIDSEQEVATILRSLVHGSTAGGVLGQDRGGTALGGDPGAGGDRGPGSHPQPLGDGQGDWFDINTSDPRLLPYFRRLHARIDPYWVNAFPRSAMLDLRQGTVILEFTIAEDGTAKVVWPPLRPSGIDEFDKNCADAIRKAGPFDPIPKELGRNSLRIRAPFVASSPIVPN
jgi:TonB family protein